jgi:penicillin-binding protein 1C
MKLASILPKTVRVHRMVLRRIGSVVLGCVALLLVANWAFPPPLEKGRALSAMVTDQNGVPLRAFPTDKGGWRFQANLEEIDPLFIEALLKIEDKRFYNHLGVDMAALVRASVTSLAAGRIVSGGSTITMQTARLLEPRPRNIGSKLVEMIRAVQIEMRLSKQEILELYLTLAPYGGNLEGVRAASLAWFGHEPHRLSDDQIALLIALPQSPEVRRPDRHPKHAKAARNLIVDKLARLAILAPERTEETHSARLPARATFPAKAWHGAARARRLAGGGDITSTLDAALQADLEALLLARAEAMGETVQMAAMVVDIPTRSVRAVVGSASRKRAGGWLDLTQQARSPGSTLKPFIYAMTFDDGAASPGTIINDLPKRFAAYRPENFDRSFRGDVTVTQALQHSLNVPAVLALERVGPERFAAQLRLAGANPRVYGGAKTDAGLALALGGAGLTLEELAILYAALGDGGVAKPLVWHKREETASQAASGTRFIGPESAAAILKILSDAPAPKGRIPGRLTKEAPQIAFKTGTSYGVRDAWAAAVSGDKAIIVWVGRADGAPRPGHVGRSDALPVLFEIADRTHQNLSTHEESADRFWTEQVRKPQASLVSFAKDDVPPEILFPPRGAELYAGTVDGKAARGFVLAGRGAGDLEWYIDGAPCPVDDAGLPVWLPEQAGFYTVSAVDPYGRTSRVRVRVIS